MIFHLHVAMFVFVISVTVTDEMHLMYDYL